MLPQYWFLWGIGFLIMPRMTIGLIILTFTNHLTLGIALSIIGGIWDLLIK